jgi:hypothetical protein
MGGTTQFGSTAPPSAANGKVYFTGLDIEEAPTLGGIYQTVIASVPVLNVVAGIGEQVPGEAPGTGFRTFGEALSVSSDGDSVAFWASWGTETFQKTLLCLVDGNPDVIAYCLQQHPTGLAVDIPVNRGIFVHSRTSGETVRVARTGSEGIEDFIFWVFSGLTPGTGGGDDPGAELARWRASAFSALSVMGPDAIHVAFKARRAGKDGIYVREGLAFQLLLRTAAEVGTTPGTDIDPMAPANSLVSAVAIERDGFRNGRMAITASMLYVDPVDPEVSLGWAGIYVAPVPVDLVFQDGFE